MQLPTMKITFKTLQQKQFQIEAEPTETVSEVLTSPSRAVGSPPTLFPQIGDLKKKIAAEQGFAVETQKIIFSGT